jgi:hypothetical protein
MLVLAAVLREQPAAPHDDDDDDDDDNDDNNTSCKNAISWTTVKSNTGNSRTYYEYAVSSNSQQKLAC